MTSLVSQAGSVLGEKAMIIVSEISDNLTGKKIFSYCTCTGMHLSSTEKKREGGILLMNGAYTPHSHQVAVP